ncbi:uncharacterized protein [Bemisia tabaci]|uniref:uncharacterized protein n=1 Tax=Bemisia tabaci TaxID=7038 RepID=UPI0008F98737|nr:PREDICTED: probable E3 ubiquitin-protein ligase sinah [Bemisia tabaci]
MEKNGFLSLPTPSKDELSLPTPSKDERSLPTPLKDGFPLPAPSRHQSPVPNPSENELPKSGPDKTEASTPFGKKEDDPNANMQRSRSYRTRILKRWRAVMKCPICLFTAEPPFELCSNGHRICHQCRVRLQSCPICRVSLANNVKDRAMEELHQALRPPPTNRNVLNEDSEEEEEAERRPQRREEERREARQGQMGLESLSFEALAERIEAIKLTLPRHLWAVARLNPGGGAILDI